MSSPPDREEQVGDFLLGMVLRLEHDVHRLRWVIAAHCAVSIALGVAALLWVWFR